MTEQDAQVSASFSPPKCGERVSRSWVRDKIRDHHLHQFAQETHRIPIERVLPGDSPRLNGEDDEHIQTLADSDGEPPPILVHRRTMRVIDGMHRLRAARIRGQSDIEVRFFDGSESEAFLHAVKANTTHGLPLGAADREAAACRIIKAQPELSDRAIAAATGLAAKTVATARRKLAADSVEGNFRIGLDGRVRPLDSRELRQAAQEIIERNPGASLREVARAVGISPTTVKDVREKMRQTGNHGHGRNGRVQTPHTEPDGPSRAQDEEEKQVSALQHLRKDPSICYTETGRTFLRWLSLRAQGPSGGLAHMSGLPPHCAYLVAAVARECANKWLRFADELEEG